MFYAPNLLGHPDNYIPANPLQTPAHIVPEWYFLPFYAILRAIPSKLFGVAALIGSIAILFFVPWLDTSRVRSTSYRPIYKWFFWAFVVTCIALGYLGSQPPEGVYLVLGRILTAYYFLFFLVVMPVVGWIEKPKALPGSITESVLGPRGNAGRRSKARASTPRAGAGGMTKSSPFGLALIAGFVVAFAGALRRRACRGRKASGRAVSHEPQIRLAEMELHRAVRHLSTTLSFSADIHVYKQICSNCHSMRLLSYRNLGEPGGPEFSPEAVDDARLRGAGDRRAERQGRDVPAPGRPSDRFRSPFANDAAARGANGGALPPDLSVMAKARPGGPDYIYALLTGYRQTPAGFDLAQGMHYNIAFPGHQIAMPPPLIDGAVPYTDGTKPTVDNYARDVSAFLMWAAEPKLEERHKLGARVVHLPHRILRHHVPGEAHGVGAPASEGRAYGVGQPRFQYLDRIGIAAEDGGLAHQPSRFSSHALDPYCPHRGALRSASHSRRATAGAEGHGSAHRERDDRREQSGRARSQERQSARLAEGRFQEGFRLRSRRCCSRSSRAR